MKKIRLILRKEWTELRQQKVLMISVFILPLLFAAMSVNGLSRSAPAAQGVAPNAATVGMTALETIQATNGQIFRALFLLLPLMIPGVIAAYSVVGEKTNRTLEPLLAAPVRVSELLLAKSLAALIPAVAATWIAAGAFVAALTSLAISPAVVAVIVTPGWLIVLLLASPLIALISIAVTVFLSSRVNDPRTAQTVTTLVLTPLLIFIGVQVFGVLVLSPAVALSVVAVLIVIAAIAFWGASKMFQREVILTRWS